jgi:ureidoacrylate peracid hydrolase
MMLRAHSIETVVPTGVSTNVCVESTLRDAFEYNYYVCIPKDGVASWNMDLHASTLTTVDARFGLVTTCAEVMDIWGAGAASASKSAAE